MAAVKLTNDVLIDYNSLKVGMDPDNVVASISAATGSSASWTATDDCWVCLCWANDQSYLSVGGKNVMHNSILVKKGTSVVAGTYHYQRNGVVRAYGTK